MQTPTEFIQEWQGKISSKDTDALISLYKEDAVLLGTFDNKVRRGRQQIKDYFESLTTLQPEVEVTQIICREICSGTVAITDGFYNFRILQNLTRIIVSARFTFVLERTGTKWYILSHHSSKKADAS